MLIFLSREDREIFARGLAWHFSDSLPSSLQFGSSKRRWLLVFIICSSHSISKIIHHSLINELDVDSNGVASNTFDWRCFEIHSSISTFETRNSSFESKSTTNQMLQYHLSPKVGGSFMLQQSWGSST